MKFTLHRSPDGYANYIELPVKLSTQLTRNGNKRVLCVINKLVELHAALFRTKEGAYRVLISSRYLRQLKVKPGDQLDVVISIDTSEFQFHIPEEFMEVFKTDPEAELIFNTLTDGNKRGLLAVVNAVKSSDKKIERALRIAEKLKMGIKSPMLMLKK